jgi:hypothetical protein
MALVTATEAATLIPSVSRHLICVWRAQGRIRIQGKRGRSPLYDWAELCHVEAKTRTSGHSWRKTQAA